MYYFFQDHLGTGLVLVDAWGHVQQQSVYYPFGGERVITNNVANNYKFTGLERDSETGLDHTLNRKYASNLGRWLSPDRWGGTVANPQSLNRYAYVLDNPCTLSDPLGLSSCDFHIAVNNAGLIDDSQIKALETELAHVFSLSTGGQVGVIFSFSGPADYSLDVTVSAAATQRPPGAPPVPPPPNAVGQAATSGNTFLNYGFAFVDRVISTLGSYNNPTNLAIGLGLVGAHEAGHFLLNIKDDVSAYGIMNGPANLLNPDQIFTGGQAIILQDKCNLLRHGHTGGMGRRGPYVDVPAGGDSGSLFGLDAPPDASGSASVGDDVGPGSGWCPDCPPPVLIPRGGP